MFLASARSLLTISGCPRDLHFFFLMLSFPLDRYGSFGHFAPTLPSLPLWNAVIATETRKSNPTATSPPVGSRF